MSTVLSYTIIIPHMPGLSYDIYLPTYLSDSLFISLSILPSVCLCSRRDTKATCPMGNTHAHAAAVEGVCQGVGGHQGLSDRSSTHPLNTWHRHTLSACSFNMPSQHIISTHGIDMPYQHALSARLLNAPINTPCECTLST